MQNGPSVNLFGCMMITIPISRPLAQYILLNNYLVLTTTICCRYPGIRMGDPSRKIVETIFQRALKDPSKPSRKIKRVLKVKNSVETLESFEKYREKVKKKAYDESEQRERHPRSTVDGNELLRFYGTVMTCGKRPAQVSELCRDPFCRVCRTIQSNFDTQHLKKNGIRLSANSEELCDTMVAWSNKVKRAVIVCRTIAGRVGNVVDGGAYEECDSFKSGLHSNIGDLIVKTPSAVLPCFVIVFTWLCVCVDMYKSQPPAVIN